MDVVGQAGYILWILTECKSYKYMYIYIYIKLNTNKYWGNAFQRSQFWEFSGPRIGSVGASCFVDDFVFCCCLSPVEVSFLLFRFVWWLDCLLLKESPSAFCSVRWLLEFSCCCGVCGFSRRWPASIWMIVLNTLLPLCWPSLPL